MTKTSFVSRTSRSESSLPPHFSTVLNVTNVFSGLLKKRLLWPHLSTIWFQVSVRDEIVIHNKDPDLVFSGIKDGKLVIIGCSNGPQPTIMYDILMNFPTFIFNFFIYLFNY